MKRVVVLGSFATIVLIVATLSIFSWSVVGDQEMPFGGKKAKDNDYLFTNDEASISLNPEQVLQERCTLCHNLDRVNKARKDRAGWEKTIDKMVKKGAKLNKAERQALVNYLSKKGNK